jgi:hypothetical protein
MTVEDHQAVGHSSPPNNGLGRGSGSSCDPVGQAPNVTIKSSQSSWMPGVDIKSDGGYVILPERAGVILCLPDPPPCRSHQQARAACLPGAAVDKSCHPIQDQISWCGTTPEPSQSGTLDLIVWAAVMMSFQLLRLPGFWQPRLSEQLLVEPERPDVGAIRNAVRLAVERLGRTLSSSLNWLQSGQPFKRSSSGVR